LDLQNRLQTTISPSALLAWYDANKRDLPWRQTKDPYQIWVSEVMLQQTQVATVIPYFERWMLRFPSIEALAEADDQGALSIWQGLGYYRRCRMLLAGASYLLAHGMPSTAGQWLKVPGVGRYTAAAIASIAYDEPIAVVDGNVERVFSRLMACDLSGAALHRAAWEWAPTQVPEGRPGDWNQALMELGATICRPDSPRCSACPLSSCCLAFQQNRQGHLPVAARKVPAIRLKREAWVHVCGDLFGLEQIPRGEWWEGLWRFPTTSACGGEQIGVIKHVVTHHKITMTVYKAACRQKDVRLTWFEQTKLGQLPMPAPQRRALKLALQKLDCSRAVQLD
jgi:A/G-specific adenine glycosylase